MSCSRRRRSCSCSCMCGWNTTKRALPAALALYIAMSALRSSCSASSPGCEQATPMLADAVGLPAVEQQRPVERRADRRGDALDVRRRCRCPRAGSRTRRRRAAPRCRTGACDFTSRCAAACSSRSPASWPSESLTFLKLSRSRNITATRCVRALRQRQRVLDAVAEQAAVGEQRQRVVERQLAQLLLERLALAHVAEVEREAGDRRVVHQVAADALERAAPVAGLDHRLDRSDDAAARRGDFGEERGQPLAVAVGPEVEQVAPDQVVGVDRRRCARRPARRTAAGRRRRRS